jgi:hypothetical protein
VTKTFNIFYSPLSDLHGQRENIIRGISAIVRCYIGATMTSAHPVRLIKDFMLEHFNVMNSDNDK